MRERNGGWLEEGELTGQVLYDKKEISYAADYASLENETYDMGQSWPFYESRETSSIFAEFSMPWRGERCRGYVSYGIREKREGLVDRFLAELYASEEHSAISSHDGSSESKTGRLAG